MNISNILRQIKTVNNNNFLISSLTNRLYYATNAKPAATDKSSGDVFANENTMSVSAADEKDLKELDLMPTIPEAEEAMEKEENFRNMIEKARNVSRLNTKRARESHYKLMPTITDPDHHKLKDVNFYRSLYAKFGKESKIDPGIAWLDEKSLDAQIELETKREMSLKQKIDTVVQKKRAEIEAREKR